MKIRYAVALAFAIGAVGVTAVQSLAARSKPPVYVVVDIDEITDAEGFKALLKTIPANTAAVKMSDGRYLARTENITALDGTAPKAFAIIAFDSVEKAKAYYDNMRDTTAMRIKVTRSRSFILDGL
jgi:uncharacterized protein (DUF1330 family)